MPQGPIARKGAAVVLLAGLLAAARHSPYPQELPQEPRFDSGIKTSYSGPGECLLHGINAETPTRMPAASILAALVCNHWEVPWRRWEQAFAVIAGALVVSTGWLLRSPACGLAAAAALSLFGWWGRTALAFQQAGLSVYVLTTAGLLLWREREPSRRRSLLVGLSIGASLLFRSSLAFLPPLLAAKEWLSRKADWRTLVLLGLTPYLFVLPWARMNWSLHHRLIPFERGEPDGNIVSGALGLVTTGMAFPQGSWHDLIGPQGGVNDPHAALSWAAEQIRRHPARYAGGVLARVRWAFSLKPTLFVLAAAGFALNWRRREARLLGLLTVYFLGIHCLMRVDDDYFAPFWPLLALLGGAAAGPLWESRSRRPRLPEAALKASLAAALVLTVTSALKVVRFTGLPPADLAAFDAAISRSPADAWLLHGRGGLRLEAGDLAAAVADLEAAVRLRPDDAEYGLDLAWGRSLRGDPGPLLAWQAPKGDAWSEDSRLGARANVLKAAALLSLGRTRPADRELEEFLRKQEPAPLVEKGAPRRDERILRSLNLPLGSSFNPAWRDAAQRVPQAARLALTREMSKLAPDNAELLIEAAALAAERGDRTLALRCLDRAASLPADPGQEERMAKLLLSMGEYRRTLAFPPPGPVEPESVSAWLSVAAGERDAGAARAALARALKQEPGSFDRIRAAVLYAGLGDLEAARRLFSGLGGGAVKPLTELQILQAGSLLRREAARAKDPARRSVLSEGLEAVESLARGLPAARLVELARLEAQAGRKDDALAALGRAESLGPEPERLREIAALYSSLGRRPKAMAMLQALLRSCGSDRALRGRILADLGVLEGRMGRTQEAMSDLRSAIAADPLRMPPYLSLGSLLLSSGRAREARELYDAALARTPLPEDRAVWRLIQDDRRSLETAR